MGKVARGTTEPSVCTLLRFVRQALTKSGRNAAAALRAEAHRAAGLWGTQIVKSMTAMPRRGRFFRFSLSV